MNNIKREFKGNLGMFLVCVELSKLNLIALPTTRNTKGYDIIVMNPDTNKATGIQVKCTDKRDFPVISTYWSDYESVLEEKILSDFVFVDIFDKDKPDYFILSDKELKEILRLSIKGYAEKYCAKNKITWEGALEKEMVEKRKPNLWALGLEQLKDYRDHWETITERLLVNKQ